MWNGVEKHSASLLLCKGRIIRSIGVKKSHESKKIFQGDFKMNNAELQNKKRLSEKLDDFLNRSCEAEAKGNYPEAERLFRLALFCEGKIRPDVTDVKLYIEQAGPVYEQAKLAIA